MYLLTWVNIRKCVMCWKHCSNIVNLYDSVNCNLYNNYPTRIVNLSVKGLPHVVMVYKFTTLYRCSVTGLCNTYNRGSRRLKLSSLHEF